MLFALQMLFALPAMAAPSAKPLQRAFKLMGSDSKVVQQLIVVTPGKKPTATVDFYEKAAKTWKLVDKTIPAVVGKNGVAMRGQKKEGDGKTPSGAFALGTAFGTPDTLETKLNYRMTTDQDFFVDDVNSPQYNTWVTGKTTAKSFELMRRKDDLYKYGVVINYNMNPVQRGLGSAIFLHLWRGPTEGTAGCVAMSEENFKQLARKIEPQKNPRIVILEKL